MHYSVEETKAKAFFPHLSTSWKEVQFMGTSVKAVCSREEGHSGYLKRTPGVPSNSSQISETLLELHLIFDRGFRYIGRKDKFPSQGVLDRCHLRGKQWCVVCSAIRQVRIVRLMNRECLQHILRPNRK